MKHERIVSTGHQDPGPTTRPLLTGIFAPLIALILLLGSPGALASDVSQLSGMYKVVSSSDPVFPESSGREWFLDFGQGIANGRNSGKVAVSLRENPNVRVRILVWQFFPDTGTLKIGNQFAEGARGAVTLADWRISRGQRELYLERDTHRVTLRPAGPAD